MVLGPFVLIHVHPIIAELSRVFDVSEGDQGVLRAKPPLPEAGDSVELFCYSFKP